MNSSTQETPKKLIKICAGCAMAHLSECRKGIEDSGGQCPSPSDRISCALAYCKQLCKVSGDVTLLQLLVLLYRVLSSATSAVVRLFLALLPIAEYILLIFVYAAGCVSWVYQEKQMYLMVLKGVASVASVVFLSTVAYLVVMSLVVPSLVLLYHLFRRGLAIM